MSRTFFVFFAAVTSLAVSGSSQTAAPTKKSALDKATMEAYVRHLYVMDKRITIQIGDPTPSKELPSFMDVKVHASMGMQAQDFQFLVSKDGSKILQGQVYDVNNNPFKSDLDKIKTAFEPSLGAPGADVVIVEFSDFQCPYCKQEAQMLRDNLVKAYPSNVRLYFKTFPLESLHPWAKTAAIASKCVFQQKAPAFWNFHDWVFDKQAEITLENFKDKFMGWAQGQKDLDAKELGQCLDTKATAADVEKDMQEARELNVDRTPTLFVNGRRIGASIDWPNLKQIIDYEAEYQKTAKNAGENCGCDTSLSLPGMPKAQQPILAPPKK